MTCAHKSVIKRLALVGVALLWGSKLSLAQVSPAEIRSPQLKALEKTYLAQLVDLNREIAGMKFPFRFVPSRYLGLDPKDQQGADQRGLEFVRFHDRTVLKISGNYNAAFNADLLTQNQRANRVLDDVVAPILALLPKHFANPTDFDAFGFEISYHVRRESQRYSYEGRENLVLVFAKDDAFAYPKTEKEAQKQEILSASEVFVDGKELGLALGERDPNPAESLDKTRPSQTSAAVESEPVPPTETESRSPASGSAVRLPAANPDLPPGFHMPPPRAADGTAPISAQSLVTNRVPTRADAEALQNKYQSQFDTLTKDGAARFHLVEYAPPSLVLFRDKIYLQLTLRNPTPFDRNGTSIYRRAAQSFDLFLAPLLKDLLAKVPDGQEISGLDITVLDQFASNAASSEALEYICPLTSLHQFADLAITNQDLINESIVLVNGVRIALNLQQVE